MRSLLLRSPGVSTLIGMMALVALVWAAPELGASRAASAQARPIA